MLDMSFKNPDEEGQRVLVMQVYFQQVCNTESKTDARTLLSSFMLLSAWGSAPCVNCHNDKTINREAPPTALTYLISNITPLAEPRPRTASFKGLGFAPGVQNCPVTDHRSVGQASQRFSDSIELFCDWYRDLWLIRTAQVMEIRIGFFCSVLLLHCVHGTRECRFITEICFSVCDEPCFTIQRFLPFFISSFLVFSDVVQTLPVLVLLCD